MVDGKINILIAKLQLKMLTLYRDAMNLIIDCTIIKYAINTGTLNMHDINRFYLQIDCANLNRIGYPDFAIYKRKNLCYNKLTSSLMHIIPLGMQISIIS